MTGLRLRPIPNPPCWHASIEFTAFPAASNRLRATNTTLVLSRIEAGAGTMTTRMIVDCNRALRIAGALIGLSVALAACTSTGGEITTAAIPEDYRLRHPIAIQEADQSVVIFVGNARGGLSASQRTDVIGLAQAWRREATGPIVADVPVDTPNAAAAADAFREIRSLLAAVGVPPRGLTVHRYRPDDTLRLATIRLNYPKISAVAGPCGLWPEDLGPSIDN